MYTGYESNYILIEYSNWYEINYSSKSYYLLSSPYQTDCIDYKLNTEYLSQKDCIRKCRRRKSIEKCNAMPDRTNFFENELELVSDKVFDEQCTQTIDLNKTCRSVCPHMDCIKFYYKPFVSSNYKTKRSISEIAFSITTEPKTSLIYRPKLETIEFLSYIASILSLWFGFSIASFHGWFLELFHLLKKFKEIEKFIR